MAKGAWVALPPRRVQALAILADSRPVEDRLNAIRSRDASPAFVPIGSMHSDQPIIDGGN
jgi:hypothetical protein